MRRSERRSWFQSHAGSIEAAPSSPNTAGAHTRFNPTLVRLRPLPPPTRSTIAIAFQSHAGSIEAPNNDTANLLMD